MRIRVANIVLLMAVASACVARADDARVVSPADVEARAETSTLLHYALHWPEGGPYVLLPPELPPLDWADWHIARTATASGEENAQIQVEIALTPHQEGDFEVPVLAFAYVADAVPLDTTSPNTMESEPVTVTVRAAAGPPPLPWLLGGGAAVLLALGMAVLTGMRVSRETQAEQEKPRAERIQDALHAAKRHRLDGDFYAYYQELTRVAELAAVEDSKLLDDLRRRTQAVGYGGTRPTEDELNGDQRAIERAVARWKEQQEQ